MRKAVTFLQLTVAIDKDFKAYSLLVVIQNPTKSPKLLIHVLQRVGVKEKTSTLNNKMCHKTVFLLERTGTQTKTFVLFPESHCQIKLNEVV